MHRFQRLQIEVINSPAFEGFLRDFEFDPRHPYHQLRPSRPARLAGHRNLGTCITLHTTPRRGELTTGFPALLEIAVSLFDSGKEKQLIKRVDEALADDTLTAGEQQALFDYARSLEIDFNWFLNKHAAMQDRVIIAGINAGRLPGAKPPYHIMVKPDEEVMLEAYASMLKEVADRAWQGGHSGVSFRIAKGVRYRTGGTRGHMQQVGTKMVVTDAGWLSVTSTRIIFSGKTSTREIHYARLVNLTVFAVGPTECLAIAVSKGHDTDTQTYAISRPHLFAAVITAAAQPHLSESGASPPPPPSNVGLISEDGAWRWDGQAWQPTGQAI